VTVLIDTVGIDMAEVTCVVGEGVIVSIMPGVTTCSGAQEATRMAIQIITNIRIVLLLITAIPGLFSHPWDGVIHERVTLKQEIILNQFFTKMNLLKLIHSLYK
jgi:hypothetical protein